MGDVYCAKCGEPWDYYGVLHGDMSYKEKEEFLKGEGCPSCFDKPEKQKDHKEKFIISLIEESDEDVTDMLI